MCGLLQDMEEDGALGITSQGRRQRSIQREKDQEAVQGAPGRSDAKQRLAS